MKLSKTIRIVKYANRKLYAPSGEVADSGGYVTLKDIVELVRKGNTVQIEDNGTSADVTDKVMLEALKFANVKTKDVLALIRNS
jgi:polyhydroxyalkanoate synthesis regulator protein